jgi:hypothetical protein
MIVQAPQACPVAARVWTHSFCSPPQPLGCFSVSGALEPLVAHNRAATREIAGTAASPPFFTIVLRISVEPTVTVRLILRHGRGRAWKTAV